MKLNRLKSVAHEALRDSISDKEGHLIDPFHHYTPEREIEIDLLTGNFTPDLEGDDVERYYKKIIAWLPSVLAKEGIPLEAIEKAQILITPEWKVCTITAQGKEFTSTYLFKT